MNYRIIIFLITLLLFNACAQFIDITGGEKDTTPPFLIEEHTFPKNKSLNFNSDKITLTFNEYFTISNPQQNVIISPSLENTIDYFVKGKTLSIKLNNQLKENTTYTINFGEAIKDYNAGNILKNFTYVFSTGNYLDSMEVKGKVIDAKSGNPVDNILVGIYNQFEDSIVSKQKPNYFARTNKDGQFKLQNISNDTYKIFALKDENRNQLFDLPNEQIAFADSLIYLDSFNSHNNLLRLFEEDYKAQKITSKSFTYPGKLELTFEKPNDSLVVSFLNKKVNILHQSISKEKDTIRLWLDGSISERFKCIVKGDSILDTININPFKKTIDTTIIVENQIKNISQNDILTLSFNRPIKMVDTSNFKIFKDSTIIDPNYIQLDSLNKKMVNISFNKSYKEIFTLNIFPNGIEDIYGKKLTDTITKTVSVYPKDFFGSLSVTLENSDDTSSYFIKLMQAGKEVKRVKYDGKVLFNQLAAGKYNLEILIDRNNNGKWDTGNYYKKIRPEEFLYHPEILQVRSNWELDETIDLGK